MKRILCLALLVFFTSSVSAAGLNDAFGLPIWQDSNLWDDSFPDAAARLGLSDGQDHSSSMKMLPLDAKILGARAYSLHLYGNGGKVNQVVIAFANKADMVNELMYHHKDQPSYKPEDALIEASRKWADEIKTAKASIIGKLQPSLGVPQQNGTSSTWNWNSHIIELSEKDSSLSVSITPSSPAPNTTNAPSYTNTKTKPNGDIVLLHVPNIDQGPRGFCAPAAWEKCLRYYGLTFNVYELADIGGTGAGGTQQLKLASSITPLLQSKGFTVDLLGSDTPTVENISSYIDQGFPIIWGMDAKDLDKWIIFNKQRTPSGLPKNGAPPIAKNKPTGQVEAAHAITVVGYSRRSNEIALSDTRSGAAEFQEIWVPSEYVETATLGERLIAIIRSGNGATSSSSPSNDRSVAPISTDTMGRKRF